MTVKEKTRREENDRRTEPVLSLSPAIGNMQLSIGETYMLLVDA